MRKECQKTKIVSNLMTMEEAASYLRLNYSSFRRLVVDRHEIDPVPIGRYKFLKSDLDAYVEKKKKEYVKEYMK